MDAIQLLFADVAQLPIITSSIQELWLGIQIRAPHCWVEFGTYSEHTLLAAIYSSLRVRSSELEARCLRSGSASPQLEVWAAEAREAYENIHTMRRSKLHQFARSNTKLNEPELANAAYDIAELLCLLPGPVLRYLADTVQRSGRLPDIDEFQAWIGRGSFEHVLQMVDERASKARATLVTGYLRYALRIARNSVGQGVEYLDLVQEGALGLMRAAERFDYREGARFATYASTWVWQSIGRALADQGRTIRLPVHVYERVCALHKALETRDPAEGLDTIAADYVSAASTKLKRPRGSRKHEKLSRSARFRRSSYRLIEYCQPLVALDLELPEAVLERDSLEDSDGVVLIDCLADGDTTKAYYLQYERKQSIQEMFDCLLGSSKRDLSVVRLRYGLDDGQGHTLEEVGQDFGLTRERIRQIESRALRKLQSALRGRQVAIDLAEPMHYPLLPRAVQDYIEETYNPWQSASSRAAESEERLLDSYLAQLPGGDWHVYRVPGGGVRQEQLVTVLRALAAPAHYSVIAEQLNDLAGDTANDTPLDEAYVYALLMKYEGVFARLGEGVFGLVEWERQRAVKTEPVLPFCPAPLPDPPAQPNAFFESVMVANEILQSSCDGTQFLNAMASWAGLAWPQPRWVCQNALSAYYLVGVIPYIFYAEDEVCVLQLTLPNVDLYGMREYCLEVLSRRLQAMSGFWWLLQHYQPIRVTELAQLFVDVHPLGLDDAANRLTLLTGIGAVQRSSSGRYELTRLGENMAARWGRHPEGLNETQIESPEVDSWGFADLSFD